MLTPEQHLALAEAVSVEAVVNLDAPAKINLCLYVGPTREDGLHELCSLFAPLGAGRPA